MTDIPRHRLVVYFAGMLADIREPIAVAGQFALGAKLANDILSGTLSVAQSAWGGPLADLAAAPEWIKLHFAVLHLAPRPGTRAGPAP